MRVLRWSLVFALMVTGSLTLMGCASSRMVAGSGRLAARTIPEEEYFDKVYGSWLGQCVGNIYGLPHECKYIDEPGPDRFPYGYQGAPLAKAESVNGAYSDDDTDIEYMYLLAMEKHGCEPRLSDLAEGWMDHVRDRVWLANRAAVAAMHYGYQPPLTGSNPVNPHWFQIDPQLVNEVWAVTAPGMVDYAVAKSRWAASVMSNEEAVGPTVFYAAMYAAAFFESDVRKLIDIGEAAVPADDRFRKTIADMKALHAAHPADWRRARQEMADRYYTQEPEDTRTIWNANLNGACAVLALLYGEGDFQRTLDLGCAIGFDADNQTATLCGLLGAAKGVGGIPHDLLFPFPARQWNSPFNDVYRNVSRYDMPDANLKDIARRMVVQGESILLAHGGSRVSREGKKVYTIPTKAQFVPPLEISSAPVLHCYANEPVSFDLVAPKGVPRCAWVISNGRLPDGLALGKGRIAGTASRPGAARVTVTAKSAHDVASRDVVIVAHGPNLAKDGAEIVAGTAAVEPAAYASLGMTIPRSLCTDTVNAINDGRLSGPHSTFLSLSGASLPKTDFFGYRWPVKREVASVVFHTGAIEQNSGWFASVDVQYADDTGAWHSVEGLASFPAFPTGKQPYDKAHFVPYMFSFNPVATRAIRIIGEPAGLKGKGGVVAAYYTSIAELEVFGPIEGTEAVLGAVSHRIERKAQ